MEPCGARYYSGLLTCLEEVDLLEKNYVLSTFQREIQKNCDTWKIRLRRTLPHLVKKDPLEVALEYFNEVLKAKLRRKDIKDAKRVKPWLGDGQDILVTFRCETVRERVYNLRTLFNGGLFFVCDELVEERVSIWKILMNRFGETNVITRQGAVCLCQGGNEYTFLSIASLKEYIWSLNKVADMEKSIFAESKHIF